jgi:hypothetical protein
VVIASSKDGLFDLKIARGRIDLYRNAETNESTYEDIHEELLSKVVKLFETIEAKVEVDWIAFINNFVFNGDKEISSDKLFNSSIVGINGGDTDTFFMRHANRFNINGTLSNNQFSIGTGNAVKNGVDKIEGLIVTQDFNSKPTTTTVDSDFIKAYIIEAKELIKIDQLVELLK